MVTQFNARKATSVPFPPLTVVAAVFTGLEIQSGFILVSTPDAAYILPSIYSNATSITPTQIVTLPASPIRDVSLTLLSIDEVEMFVLAGDQVWSL